LKSYEFLFWAYNVIWIALAAFMGFILLRLGRTARRVDGVERALATVIRSNDQESSPS